MSLVSCQHNRGRLLTVTQCETVISFSGSILILVPGQKEAAAQQRSVSGYVEENNYLL